MAANDNDGPGVSDEEWARFMERAAEGSAGAPREPSARQRMVTERLRNEPEPPGWRTGPGSRERQARAGRRRGLKAALAVAAIAGAALVAVRPELLIDRVTGAAEGRRASAATTLAPETIAPTAAPPSVDPDLPTPREPFRGSPALRWADGAAGIELPAAEAVGGMTQAQVADALEKTRRFLIASNLDPAVLRGERPEAALALLDPKDEQTAARLDASLAKPGREQDPLNLFTRYDPARLALVGEVVKVRGRMWVEPGGQPGQARIRADYTFVYPFVKAAPGADQVERTIVRREITLSIADRRTWESTPGRLWLETSRVDLGNSACEVYDGYLHPAFDGDPVAGATPSGTPEDPYDRSKGIDTAGQEGCGSLTRS